MTPEALKEALAEAEKQLSAAYSPAELGNIGLLSHALLELNEAHWDMQKNFETSQSMLAEAEKENERLLADNEALRAYIKDLVVDSANKLVQHVTEFGFELNSTESEK